MPGVHGAVISVTRHLGPSEVYPQISDTVQGDDTHLPFKHMSSAMASLLQCMASRVSEHSST